MLINAHCKPNPIIYRLEYETPAYCTLVHWTTSINQQQRRYRFYTLTSSLHLFHVFKSLTSVTFHCVIDIYKWPDTAMFTTIFFSMRTVDGWWWDKGEIALYWFWIQQWAHRACNIKIVRIYISSVLLSPWKEGASICLFVNSLASTVFKIIIIIFKLCDVRYQ